MTELQFGGQMNFDRPTSRQRDVLALLRDRHTRTGVPPSIREMAEALHISVSTVHQHLQALARIGAVHRVRGFYVVTDRDAGGVLL